MAQSATAPRALLQNLFIDSATGLGHVGVQWNLLVPLLRWGCGEQGAVPAEVSTHRNVVVRESSSATGSNKSATAQTLQWGDAMELIQNIGAGALARTIAQCAIHPLDTIKTRLQVSDNINALQSWQSTVAATCRPVQLGGFNFKVCSYVGPFGLGDLYLGLAGAVLGTLPSSFLFFCVDEAMKRTLTKRLKKDRAEHWWLAAAKRRRNMLVHIASASAASCASALLRVPCDVLKHRVQAYMYTNVWQAAQAVWVQQGLRGFYCGFGATLMRDVPEMTIQFTVYEALRKVGEDAAAKRGAKATAATHPLLLGGVAGATAALFSTPLDVIKTQLQCNGFATPMAALQSVVQSRGPMGLMAGLGPRVAQTALMSALFFTCYEVFKHQLAQHRAQQAAACRVAVVETAGAHHAHANKGTHAKSAAGVRVHRPQAKQMMLDAAEPL